MTRQMPPHPAVIIRRKIAEQSGMKKVEIKKTALRLGVPYDTFSSMIHQKRRLSTTVAIKLEEHFNNCKAKELMICQISYDIAKIKQEQGRKHPGLSRSL
ncbi:MAG: helix-turn-helix transcriptional regulator [Nitrospiraceae bacterium]